MLTTALLASADLVAGTTTLGLGWLVRASAEATAIAALILLAQLAFGRWLTPAWRYRLWALVVLRLVLPVSPASSLSVWNFAAALDPSAASEPATATASATPTTPKGDRRQVGLTEATSANGIKVAVRYEPFPISPAGTASAESQSVVIASDDHPGRHVAATVSAPPTAAAPTVARTLAAVWLVGVLCLLTRLAVVDVRFRRRLRPAEPVTDAAVLTLLRDCCRQSGLGRTPTIWLTDAVRGPATTGVWQPSLLFPPGLLDALSTAERRIVLLHELAHVRHRDVAANWLLAIVQAVHWFNPAVWLAFARLRADRELTRDAAVIAMTASHAGCTAADDYARTLLSLVERLASRSPASPGARGIAFPGTAGIVGDGVHPLALGLLGRRSGLQRRLRMITAFPSASTRRFAPVGPVLLLAIGCGTLTRPRPSTEPAAGRPHVDSAAATTRPAAPSSGAPRLSPDEVKTLIAEARRAVTASDYRSAMAVIDRILSSDPQNEYAKRVRPLVEDRLAYQTKLATHPSSRTSTTEGSQKVMHGLDRKLPEVRLENMGLADAIDFIRNVSQADIYVDWKALEAAGIDKSKMINLQLYNVKVAKALTLVLDGVSTPDAKVVYAIGDGLVTVSTADKLQKPSARPDGTLAADKFGRLPSGPVLVFPASQPSGAWRGWEPEGGRGNPLAVAALEDPRERLLPEVRIENVALAEAIDYVAELAKTPIAVDWPRLKAIGVVKTTHVSVRLSNVRPRQVLDAILDQILKPGGIRQFAADDGRPFVMIGVDVHAKVEALIAECRKLDDRREYSEAEVVVHRILQLDPTNDYGQGMKPIFREAAEAQRLRAAATRPGLAEPEVTVEDRLARAQLDKRAANVSLDNVDLPSAIDWFRKSSEANVFVDWRGLEAIGVDKGKAVSIRLANVKFGKVLSVILDSYSTAKGKVAYSIDDGVVNVGTTETLARIVSVQVYDIRDLLVAVPDYVPPADGLAKRNASTRATPPAATRPADASPEAAAQTERLAALNDIIRLIQETVSPELWRDNRGSTASIKELSGQLVVTQTPENHRSIARLLQQLREARGVQVTVEGRFIGCDGDAIEQLMAKWQREAASRPAGGPFADGVTLSEAQADELLRLVQASRDAAVVTAPRLTLFSGQRAYVSVTRSTSYVRDHATIVGPGGEVRYEPVVDVVEPGVLMDVSAAVAADRKSVSMTLRPKLSTLAGLIETPWPGRPAVSTLTVQVPSLMGSELQTRVSVADGGWILLGGLRDPGIAFNAASRSTTRAVDQPIGLASTRESHPRRMYLLVKPRIILPREVDLNVPTR